MLTDTFGCRIALDLTGAFDRSSEGRAMARQHAQQISAHLGVPAFALHDLTCCVATPIRSCIEVQPLQRSEVAMRFGINLLRAALAAVVGICLWQCGTANAAAVEYLQVPSPSMGRDIPVAFHGGRSARGVPAGHVDAGPDVSNWVPASTR